MLCDIENVYLSGFEDDAAGPINIFVRLARRDEHLCNTNEGHIFLLPAGFLVEQFFDSQYELIEFERFGQNSL